MLNPVEMVDHIIDSLLIQRASAHYESAQFLQLKTDVMALLDRCDRENLRLEDPGPTFFFLSE